MQFPECERSSGNGKLNMRLPLAASVLGAISSADLSIPLLFTRYGGKLKKKSKVAPWVED